MLFGASADSLPYAMQYMTIYVSGTIFVQLALGLNSFITTQGFAKTSMFTVIIGAGLNIVLDPVFIFVFQMGVQGAAVATVLSQAISSIWVLWFLFGKRTILKLRPKNFRLNHKIVLPVLALGLSPFIMQATESAVNIVLNSSLQRYGCLLYTSCVPHTKSQCAAPTRMRRFTIWRDCWKQEISRQRVGDCWYARVKM